MNLSHFHCQASIFQNALKANHSSSGTSSRVTCYLRRKTSVAQVAQTIPARDRVIDFGKYKGKMLGTLPSSYLKWVSKNLRARDFEEWAKLADQVLQDPIYKDRIEWELAENVLNGNKLKTVSCTRDAETSSAVSELLEMSERFGWDNKDKVGWSKINFEFLGTSKGGRIPRLSISMEKETNITKQKNGHLEVLSEGEARRRERRGRQKMRKQAVFGESKLRLKEKSRGSFVNDPDPDADKAEAVYQSQKNMDMDLVEVDDKNLSVQNGNPFPGRQSLLRKAFNLLS
ncbi:hypothetical protein L6164_004642 [Bauhinia variegata]|uniref:Uncharacterized protein n=1 Tax=Bauhinia variegata TaxID=167791 RepID=A0ACB9Q4I1_BAUVA|nr:hypothetical protein L6164_004642 [Bauhinia variegata]